MLASLGFKVPEEVTVASELLTPALTSMYSANAYKDHKEVQTLRSSAAWCNLMSSIIVEALQRERALLRVKARILRSRIEDFEKRFNMKSEEFLEKFESGELGDDEEFFLWWSFLQALKGVEERMKIVESKIQEL